MSSGVATIDAQCRASYEIVRHQHGDCIRYVFGIADSVYQVQAGESAGVIDTVFGMEWCFDDAS